MSILQEGLLVSRWLKSGSQAETDGQEQVIFLPELPPPPKSALVRKFPTDPLYPARKGLTIYWDPEYPTTIAREILDKGIALPTARAEGSNLRKATVYTILTQRGQTYCVQRPMSWGETALRGRAQIGPVGNLGIPDPVTLQILQVMLEAPQIKDPKTLRQRVQNGQALTAWALPELLEEVVIPPGRLEVCPAGLIAPDKGPFALLFLAHFSCSNFQEVRVREERGEHGRISHIVDWEVIPEGMDTWTQVLMTTIRELGPVIFFSTLPNQGSTTYRINSEGTVYVDGNGKGRGWLCVTPDSEAFNHGGWLQTSV